MRRAILLGMVGKSMSLLDRPREPLRNLGYFVGLLEEVRTESFRASYWWHLEFNLHRCESVWRTRPIEGVGSARPEWARADLSGGARKSSSAPQVEHTKETG